MTVACTPPTAGGLPVARVRPVRRYWRSPQMSRRTCDEYVSSYIYAEIVMRHAVLLLYSGILFVSILAIAPPLSAQASGQRTGPGSPNLSPAAHPF